MKNLNIIIVLTLMLTPLFSVFASTSEDYSKKIGYYQIRYQIACRDYDTTDARCFWNKVEYVHAKEMVGDSSIADYLTESELERIGKKIGFLESRYTQFCENTDEPAYFCSALGKLVDKGNYFTSNGQKYLPLGSDLLDETYAEGVIEDYCKEQWPDDFSMRAYCEENEEDGLNDLKRGKPSDISNTDFDIVRDHCSETWEDNYSMWAYCEDDQFDSIRELAEGKPSDISDNDFATIRTKCKSDWPDDFSMRVYCEKDQYDGLRKLNE